MIIFDLFEDNNEKSQGVAEGSEHEGLVLQFLKSITPKELRYYSIRDNCGPAALHMMDWAKEKGIELHRVNGYFVADNVVYDKADFTKEMKHEFLQQGLDFNDPKSRQEFIASNPKYSKEWKKVPHYWLQDDQGTVYDPTGYIQFIKTGLAKDLDKSRYETVQGVAEGIFDRFKKKPTPSLSPLPTDGSVIQVLGRDVKIQYDGPHSIWFIWQDKNGKEQGEEFNTRYGKDSWQYDTYGPPSLEALTKMIAGEIQHQDNPPPPSPKVLALIKQQREKDPRLDRIMRDQEARNPSFNDKRTNQILNLKNMPASSTVHEQGIAKGSQSFHNGMQVKLTPEYADRPDEVFTVSHCDQERGRCWIGDEQGRGWSATFDQLIPVEDDDDDESMFENTPPMSAREKLQRAVDREKKQAQLDRTGLAGMDYDQVHQQLRGIQDRTKPKKVDEAQDTEGVERAIMHRIMVGRKDLLLKYSPQRVMEAVENVAYNVDKDNSDVGAWVNQVEQALGGVSEAKAVKTRLDPHCWTGKKIGTPKTKVKGGVRVNNCVPK